MKQPLFASKLSGPFTHAPTGVQKTMFTVLLALVPATVFDLVLFGWPAVFLFVTTIAACVATEALCLTMAGQPVKATLADCSAVLTGWLLAMTLPPWAPWWIGALGAVFAIALAKHAFGGLGQNLFNPAMVARVALLVSFPVAMTAWVMPHPMLSASAPTFGAALSVTFGGGVPDALSAATALGHVKTELSRGTGVAQSLGQIAGVPDMAMGLRAGSLGETSAVLILCGGLFMLARRIISWHIPASLLGSLFLSASLAHLADPQRFASGSFHLLSGASLLGAFFIATDYVTSPTSGLGKLIFGAGCGLLVWLIRSFAGYPEGMAFAVLLMNSLTPIIDQYTRPRLFGRNRRGEALPPTRGKP